MDNDELGLKEIRNGFDLKEELSAVTDAVHGHESGGSGSAGSSGPSGTPDRLRKREGLPPGEAPPFDSDAT